MPLIAARKRISRDGQKRTIAVRPIRSPPRRRERPPRIVNEPALLFLLALNVLLHITILNFALTEGTPSSAFVSGLVLVLGASAGACRAIIEAHGGRLWATEHTSQGAFLQFTIPA